MRKFWIVLLSVGLIVALVAPVIAADVKFSGSYVVQGYYEDNRRIADVPGSTVAGATKGPSDSFTWQRLRVGTVFQVAEGLSLTTRFDAMEKVWGAARGISVPTVTSSSVAIADSNGIQQTGSTEAENLKFQHVYVTFNTGIGRFLVGYQAQTAWGTSFGDSSDYAYGPRVRWDMTVGPSFFGLIWDKYEGQDSSYASYITGNNPQTDASKDKYSVFYVYNWAKGSAGLLGQFAIETRGSGASVIPPDNGFKKNVYLLDPYFKGQFGPVYVEAEFIWVGGKLRIWESTSSMTDITYNGYSAYALAKVDLKPAYVGAAFVYISGDDQGTTDKVEAGIPGGADFNPCLILGNYDLARWSGGIGNAATAAFINTANTYANANASAGIGVNGVGLENVWAYQVFAGVVPVPKLDIKASLTYAYFDRTPGTNTLTVAANNGTDGAWVSKSIGWEADVTATYKIYDNLSWMVGFGYLFAGDAFKGTNPAANVNNDYLLTHKLTLTF